MSETVTVEVSLACQTVCGGAAKKQSGHCCTLSVNTRNVIRLHQCAKDNVIIVSVISVNRLKERFKLTMFDESLLKVFNLSETCSEPYSCTWLPFVGAFESCVLVNKEH